MHPEAITSKQNEILKKLPIPPDFYLGRRATRKDYVDLYFILKEKHVELQKLIDIAQKKYKEEFDPRLFLEQLLYLDDIPSTPITFLKEEPSQENMLEIFEEAIKKVKL